MRPPASSRFEKPSNATSYDPYSRFGTRSVEASMSLAHTERRGTAASGSWKLRDIDWKFCFRAQHYGTAFFGLFIIIALGLIHWLVKPASRPFCKQPHASKTPNLQTAASAPENLPAINACQLAQLKFCVLDVQVVCMQDHRLGLSVFCAVYCAQLPQSQTVYSQQHNMLAGFIQDAAKSTAGRLHLYCMPSCCALMGCAVKGAGCAAQSSKVL